MLKVEKALRIALVAHAGQTERNGLPYVFHPIRVSENVNTEDEKIVALLHDVVEDSEMTLLDIAHEFNSNIIDAVQAITKEDGQDYDQYLKEVKANKLARVVKLADLEDNQNADRLPKVSKEDAKRMVKYAKATAFLKG